jgi:DNA invertase Pin-like site-specific DNA recombinase
MKHREAAFYARVSSEQQSTAHTILSQVAALRQRMAEDGVVLLPEREFIDEGYSGATLPLDERIARVENRSCLQRRSDPSGAAEPA